MSNPGLTLTLCTSSFTATVKPVWHTGSSRLLRLSRDPRPPLFRDAYAGLPAKALVLLGFAPQAGRPVQAWPLSFSRYWRTAPHPRTVFFT